MDWVPELQNDDLDELKARADGRFGVVDCFQWPQMFCKEFEYAVCIPRKETSPISLQFAWYTPTTADFDIQPGTAFAVGTLHSHIVDGIDNLLTIARKRVEAWRANRAGKNDIVTPMLSSLKHDISVLRRHPLTYRDIIVFVAQAQRSFLDIIAFMDYVEIVQPRLTTSSWSSWSPLPGDPKWMGCFTDDSKTCDNFLNAGVPVWLVRAEAYIPYNINIIKPVILTFPDNITKSIFSEAGKVVQPFPLIYRGRGGFNRHCHTRRAYTGTFGMNPSSSTLPQNPASGKAPSQGQQNKKARKIASSQLMKASTCITIVIKARTLPFSLEDSKTNDAQRNRDKWEDLRCPENPESIGFWKSAFQKADKDKGRVKQDLVDRGYRFPEPALLITPTSPERKKLFVANWLAARPLWISRVDHNPPEKSPSPQLWRDFLNSSPSGESSATASSSSAGPTAAAKRKQAAKEIFGEDLLDAEGSTWAIQATLVWRNETISVASLSDPPTRLMRRILWELYELNFRYELQALDRVMARASWEESLPARRDLLYSIFPEEGGFASPIPEGDRGGLWSCEIGDIFPYVNSFRNMLSSWENAPPRLSAPLDASTFNATTYFEVMQPACNFYVQCFFDHFGRPPVVPHCFPA
jgi:hypothetical protein